MNQPNRVVTYIDGFNLYFGIRDAGLRRYLWLNVVQLSQRLLKPNQQLVTTKYFTSRISGPAAKRQRQTTYIEALETLAGASIFYGKYQNNPRTCHQCGYQDSVPNEKMTDVNIAVELMADAYQNIYDTAILVSADSDLIGPVKAVRHLFPSKRVIIAFPPHRFSADLKLHGTATTHIGRDMLAKAQFPNPVNRADGFALVKPATWI